MPVIRIQRTLQKRLGKLLWGMEIPWSARLDVQKRLLMKTEQCLKQFKVQYLANSQWPTRKGSETGRTKAERWKSLKSSKLDDDERLLMMKELIQKQCRVQCPAKLPMPTR